MGTNNPILIKHDSGGNPLLGATVVGGTFSSNSSSSFLTVSIDSNNIVYVGGYSQGGSYYFNSSSSTLRLATSINTSSRCAIIVAYDSFLSANWAKNSVLSNGTSEATFNSIKVSNDNSVYAAGYQKTTYPITYGTGINLTGINSGSNAILVKYASDGSVIWATTPTSGSSASEFKSIDIDANGDIVAAGTQQGNTIMTYGPNVNLTGSSTTGNNLTLIKYLSGGTPKWAKSVNGPGNMSTEYRSVCLDPNGKINAAGMAGATGTTYALGADVSLTVSSGFAGDNPIITQYLDQ
jgi:hypothetical protein